MTEHEEFEAHILTLLEYLQDSIAQFELLNSNEPGRLTNGSTFIPRLVLRKTQKIKITMDANRNHATPHIHLSVGHEHHASSYNVKTGEILAGERRSQYDKQIVPWIKKNRKKLIEIWDDLREGDGQGKSQVLKAQLKGNIDD